VGALDDVAVAAPSLLPGWTRGHVATHVAHSATAMNNLLHTARTGEARPMYPSAVARAEAIAAGADRPAASLVADLAETAAAYSAAVRGLTLDRWDTEVALLSGRVVPARFLLPARMREVEFHHVDLDVGYTPAHWDPGFVTACLDEFVSSVTGRPGVPNLTLRATDGSGTHTWTVVGSGPPVTISGPRNALLGWAAGRSAGDGLQCSADVLPMLPPWP
jgi:maleylpyruvate isomerase